MTADIANGMVPAHQVIEQALGLCGQDGAIVIVEDISEAEIRFANNKTTTNGIRFVRQVTIVSISETGRSGPPGVGIASATTTGSAYDLARLAAAATTKARLAPGAVDAASLLEPGSAASRVGRHDSFDFEQASPLTGPSVFRILLDELSEVIARNAASQRVLSGFMTHGISVTYLGTSTGLRLRHLQPAGTLELVARGLDNNGDVASSWAGRSTRDFADVSLLEMDDLLAKRLSWAKRRIELREGRYETILPGDAVADLMIVAYEAASGRDAEDGNNVFSSANGGTRLGERLCATGFNLFSDPSYPGLECANHLVAAASGADQSVFDNGLEVGKINWISNGTLERLRYHRARAMASGLEPTPPAENLVLQVPGATKTLDEMISTTSYGLLLTCLWYIREVDPMTLLQTGLTRDGVYLVKDGEVVGAVNNFRFNESPLDMLVKTIEAGMTGPALSREWGEWMTRTAMPPLRVAQFNMSSVSPAI